MLFTDQIRIFEVKIVNYAVYKFSLFVHLIYAYLYIILRLYITQLFLERCVCWVYKNSNPPQWNKPSQQNNDITY